MSDEILKQILAELKGIRSDLKEIKSSLQIENEQPETNEEVKSDNKKIPKKLKKYRIDHGYTIYSLADKLGVNFSTVSYWENGEKFPRQKKMTQLEDIFKVGYRELFSDMSPDEIEEIENRNDNNLKHLK